jgi:hypothetical protein
MPAEHREEAIADMRRRALELLEPLRAELGPRTGKTVERELLDTINEIDRTA